MSSFGSKNIVILGAGIIGLSTAHRLIELHEEITKSKGQNLNITIIAEKFAKETTSDGAGGLFRPDDRFMPGVDKQTANQWVRDSFDYFHKLLFSPEGGNAGVFQASGYQLFDDERHDPSYKDFVYQFRHLTEDELKTFPRKFKYGYYSTTICIDTRLYMKYLTDILINKGVKFIAKKVNTQEEFIRENPNYDVIFNCLGFGSIQFCNDNKVVPIRGQMIRVKAPWIKHYYYTDDNCYIIPNVNTICLGGTRQLGNFSLDTDQADKNGIFERCKELCPSLENATIEWDWVGLRPHREPTRVEKEKINANSKNIIIIHNYGHGGNGISLSRGTVLHAVNLFLQELEPNRLINSKL